MIKQVKKIQLKHQNAQNTRNVKLSSLALPANKNYARSNKTTKSTVKKKILGTLEEYMHQDLTLKSEKPHKNHNQIFKEIEKNAKVYEDELLKFLGADLKKNQPIPNKSFDKLQTYKKYKIQQIAAINKSWSQQLKKLDVEEEKILKSLKSLEEKHVHKNKKIQNPALNLSEPKTDSQNPKRLKIISKFILQKLNKN